MGQNFVYVGYKDQFKRFPLSEEDQLKLIEACKDFDDRIIVMGLLDTGMRVSEFCNLQRENFNFREETVKVFGKRGPYGQEKKYRIIPLTERTALLFNNYFNIYDKIKWTNRAIQKRLERIRERVGIKAKVTPHILRHSFAVNCIKKNINLRTLQLMMGHSSIAVTQIYLSLAPTDIIQEFKEKML